MLAGAALHAALTLFAVVGLTGCGEQVDDYLPVSAIAGNGFASDRAAVAEAQGRHIRLWGFVDHGNLYGDAGAKRTLDEFWAGDGPNVNTWRFDLKGAADDAVGRSFAVHIPNDAGRDALLRRFTADARGGTPTKVFVSGRLFTFEAPTQALDLTGVYLELDSSGDVRFESAGESP